MSSAASSSGSSKTETKITSDGPPPSMGTASSHPSGRVPTTSSPVTSATLRAAAGSDNGRSRGLRPEAPVSPRVPLGGSPPAHLACFRGPWEELAPSLQARFGAVSIPDLRASLNAAEAAQDTTDPASSAADLHAIALAEEEFATVMRPMQAEATDLENQRRLNAAAMLSAGRQHHAYLRHIRGESRPSRTAYITEHPAAPAALAASHAPAALEWRQVAAVGPCRNDRALPPPARTARNDRALSPPARTARAPSPLAQVAPHPMAPPDARVHFATVDSWSRVAHRRQPGLHSNRRPDLPSDRYTNLRISRLRNVNKSFPSNIRQDVKEVAVRVEAAFREFGSTYCCVATAIELATKPDTNLRDPLFSDILRLRDLLDKAYACPSGAAWIQDVARQTASSGSDTSSSAGPRRREEPSSGRGNSKKVSLTSDSEDHQPESRGRYFRDHRKG